jgi:hypothetical protein
MRNRYRPRQNRQRHHPDLDLDPDLGPDLGPVALDRRRPDPDPSPDLAELSAALALAPVHDKKIG